MTLAKSAESLHAKLRQLRDSCQSLQTTILEDKPLIGECVLTGVLSDAVDAWQGWLDETIQAISEQQACPDAGQERETRQALSAAHEIFAKLLQHFFDDLISQGRLEALAQLAMERGGEWRAWSESVRESLRDCCTQVIDVSEAFLRCWQELQELSPNSSVGRQRADPPFRVLTGGKQAGRQEG